MLPCPETLDRVADVWSHGGHAWTFGWYGQGNSSAPPPPQLQRVAHIVVAVGFLSCWVHQSWNIGRKVQIAWWGIDPTTHHTMNRHSTMEPILLHSVLTSLIGHSTTFYCLLNTAVTKASGMYYPVCGMLHIKEPLLLIENSSPCGGSGFPFSLSEWSFTIIMFDAI